MRNLVFLGRLEERNGPDVAIDAFARIAPRAARRAAAHGGRRADAREAAGAGSAASCAGAWSFWARVYDQRPELLASSSVFLLPARAVGFSIMVLEAFAAGLPVVALPALGTDRAGEHWSNVILARDNSAEAFAAAVVETLQRDQSERIARGRAIADAFDWTQDRQPDPRRLPGAAGSPARAASAAPEGRGVARPHGRVSHGRQGRGVGEPRASSSWRSAAGVALILALPGPGRAGEGRDPGGGGAGRRAVVAFREIPAFDPLGRVRWRLPRRPERACAITFDDGPSAGTPRVLEILGRHQVKATFFVLAANARRHPDVLRALVAQGHTVAVHGVTHKKIHRDSQASVERELTRGDRRAVGAGRRRPPVSIARRTVSRAERRWRRRASWAASSGPGAAACGTPIEPSPRCW